MPTSGNDKPGRRAAIQCLADILGNLIANGVGAKLTAATGAAAVATVGTAAAAGATGAALAPAALPAAGILALFLGVRYWLASSEARKSADFESWLRKALDTQAAASDRQLAEDVVRDFDSRLDYTGLEHRLRFLRAAVRTVQEHEQDAAARLAALTSQLDSLHDAQQAEFSALERILRDHHADLHDMLVGVSGRLAELADWLRPVPPLHIPRRPYDPHSPTGALHYSTRGVAFQGRTDEMAALRAFVDERDPQDASRQRPFCWLLACGPGGAGKSRSALELCLEFEPIWRVGFLSESALDSFDPNLWRNWRPDEPTLIVVDYVARYPAAVGTILRTLQHAKLAYPVRLLLLERDAPSGWAETSWGRDLLGSGGDELDAKEAASTTMARDERGHRVPLTVGALPSESLWAVICDLLDQLHTPRPSRADALRLLAQVDEEARPLFAVMLAHFLAERPDAASTSFSRETLLRFILDRERQRWARLHADKPEYLNLLCLATLCGGLRRAAQNDPLAYPALAGLLPAPAQFDAQVYALLCGADARHELPPLEPDILGELFVLERLRTEDAVKTQRLVDAAWTLRPYDEDTKRGVVIAMLRMVRDFGAVAARREQVEALWMQRPSDGRGRLARAQMLAELCGAIGEKPLTELRTAAQADDRPPIRDALASGLYNVLTALGAAGQVGAALERLAELRELRQADNRPPIREALAKGLINAAAGLRAAGQVDPALERLAELRELRHADDRPPIRELLAIGLTNAAAYLGASGQVDTALERLAELRELRLADNRPPIRDALASGLYNVLTALAAAGQVGAALERLAELRDLRHADDRPPIREALAKALCNMVADLGTAGQVDAALERLAELRELRQADDRPPIREALTAGLHNVLTELGAAGRVDVALECLAELRELRQADDRPLIRQALAEALANAAMYLGASGQADAALERLAELRALRQADDRPGIREALAGGLTNGVVALCQARRIDETEPLLAELLVLAKSDGSQAAALALGQAHLVVGSAERQRAHTQDAEGHFMYARSLARQCFPLADFIRRHFPGLEPPPAAPPPPSPES